MLKVTQLAKRGRGHTWVCVKPRSVYGTRPWSLSSLQSLCVAAPRMASPHCHAFPSPEHSGALGPGDGMDSGLSQPWSHPHSAFCQWWPLDPALHLPGVSVLIREMGAILHLPQRVGSKDKMAQSRISHTYGGTCQKCRPWGWPVSLVG